MIYSINNKGQLCFTKIPDLEIKGVYKPYSFSNPAFWII